ncbi:hypothetical protein SAMN05444392_102336 [Seinonella peptonophila]|uniref:Uncharacterized protein n=1 Tax=Seinonella peptonophila TaxID=112248 RepID=A0A1M4VFU8_9BACL|nr:hypothetical protein [Seinonella peptonophila]SHE67703.1 hypothetical protein SAMN05444392_102336 [Seinonella peptonophila]
MTNKSKRKNQKPLFTCSRVSGDQDIHTIIAGLVYEEINQNGKKVTVRKAKEKELTENN